MHKSTNNNLFDSASSHRTRKMHYVRHIDALNLLKPLVSRCAACEGEICEAQTRVSMLAHGDGVHPHVKMELVENYNSTNKRT